MAIAKNRLYMICGICGSNEHLSYNIEKDWICDTDGVERDGVCISCDNCDSITGLDEVIKEERD
jgi:hypothetical protein